MVVSARALRHLGDPPAAVAHERLRSALRQPARPDVVLAVVEEARRAGGPIAAAQVLALAHHRLLRPGLGELRHRVAEDLIAEGSRTLRHSDTVTGLLWRAVDYILDGDARAARCLTELRALLAVRDEPAVRYVLQAIEVMLETRAGRFESAERRAEECAALGAEVGDVDANAWYGSHLIAIRWYQGRVAQLVPMIRKIAAASNLSPEDHSYQSALAVAAAAAGHRDEALEALSAACDRGLRQLPRSGSWLVAMYGIVEGAFVLGQREVAGQAYRLLVPYAALPATAGPAVSCFGSVEHALGLARLTLGDAGGAVGHLERAVRHNTGLGHFPAAILARARLAQALAQCPEPASRARAAQEAAAARRDADELGMSLPPAPTPSTTLMTSTSAGTAITITDAPPPAPAVGARAGMGMGTGVPSCRRHGRHWQVNAAGRTIRVEHCRGLTYLAVLLANPGTEIPALELTTTPQPGMDGPATGDTVAMSRIHAAQPVLDERALRQYRQRIKTLQHEIGDREALADDDGAARARAEHEWVQAQVRSAVGFAGRVRAFPSADERARIAVGKAIRRALARITEADPEIGRLLGAGIRTGQVCSYLQDLPCDDSEYAA